MSRFPYTVTLGGCTFTLVAPSPLVQIRFAHRSHGLSEEDAIRMSFAAFGVCFAPGQPVPWSTSPKDLLELGDVVAAALAPLAGALAAYKVATQAEVALFDLIAPDTVEVEDLVGNSVAPGESVSSAVSPPPDTGVGTDSGGSA